MKLSRMSDDDLRAAVERMSEDEKEKVIERLGISHTMFLNWLNGKDKLVNSKVRNKLIHIVKESA